MRRIYGRVSATELFRLAPKGYAPADKQQPDAEKNGDSGDDVTDGAEKQNYPNEDDDKGIAIFSCG